MFTWYYHIYILFYSFLCYREGSFGNVSDRNTILETPVDSVSTVHVLELDEPSSQLWLTTDSTNNINEERSYLSYDQLLNLVSPTDDLLVTQTDINVDMFENISERQIVREFSYSRVKTKWIQLRLIPKINRIYLTGFSKLPNSSIEETILSVTLSMHLLNIL